MRILRSFFMFFVILAAVFLLCLPGMAEDIPFIDAHSQMAKGLDPSSIIPLMDKAGVRITLLSARNDRRPADVIALATEYPDRIIPMVRTKGKAFNNNTSAYYTLMKKQLVASEFKGMAEILMFHAKKGNKAPEIAVYPNEPQAKYAIEQCLERGWPIIAHIEFAAAKGNKKKYMKELEKLLKANPDHPVLLIHMAQLNAEQVGKLLGRHRNLHFMTSHSNPLSVKGSNQPWVNMFKGKKLAPEWKKLMIKYPDQFVLTFDNVWPGHWGEFYLKQARLWRSNLEGLPSEVAHAIAHRNAERLWDLPSIQ